MCNFVQFSWDAGFFFFFFFTVAYLQILTILITRIVNIIFENLEDVLSIFFGFTCMLYSLSFLLFWSFYCGFTCNTFIHIVYKIQGLNLLVILGTYVISFAALNY